MIWDLHELLDFQGVLAITTSDVLELLACVDLVVGRPGYAFWKYRKKQKPTKSQAETDPEQLFGRARPVWNARFEQGEDLLDEAIAGVDFWLAFAPSVKYRNEIPDIQKTTKSVHATPTKHVCTERRN